MLFNCVMSCNYCFVCRELLLVHVLTRFVSLSMFGIACSEVPVCAIVCVVCLHVVSLKPFVDDL